MMWSIDTPRIVSFGALATLLALAVPLIGAERPGAERMALAFASSVASPQPRAPRTGEISTGALARLINGRNAPVAVFDLRSAEEFAVSRIPGAIRVEPAISADAFLAEHGAKVRDRMAVFYCPAGIRSAAFVPTVERELVFAGARGAVSLKGGIIAWTNDGRWLRDDKGATASVHPAWPELMATLRRPDLVRFEPRR